MTQYLKERLSTMTSPTEIVDYLAYFMGGIEEYMRQDDHHDIKSRNGGYNQVKAQIKQYLETDFDGYRRYIFSPLDDLKMSSYPETIENKMNKVKGQDLKFDIKKATLWNLYVK